jgi:parallel beta-helix repeat protein
LVANRATLTGVTVTNPNFRGYGVWIESSNPNVTNNTFTGNTHDGISIVGKSTPLIRSNLFQRNGANGITIFGSARPEIRENIFDNTGFGINVGMNAAPQILQNRIRNNKDGVVVQASARPVLRGNLIENNQRDGLVAIALAIPDLGTRVQPGRNIIRGNGRFDVNNATKTQTTLAFGNQLLSSRIKGSVDLMGNARPVLEMATPPTLSPGTSVPTRTPVSARPPISIPVSPSPSVSSRPPISIPVPTASGVPTRSTIPISVPAPANLPDMPPPPRAPPSRG